MSDSVFTLMNALGDLSLDDFKQAIKVRPVRGFEAISALKNDDIKLPKRSTAYSAGYDFYAPYDIEIPQNIFYLSDGSTRFKHKPFCIKTGIKAFMGCDEVLMLFMRSSAPSKLGLVMANSVGIIDSDYYDNEENEGEIGFLVYNLTDSKIKIKKGEKIGQGIFLDFLKVPNDNAQGIRNGGFGSTGK